MPVRRTTGKPAEADENPGDEASARSQNMAGDGHVDGVSTSVAAETTRW